MYTNPNKTILNSYKSDIVLRSPEMFNTPSTDLSRVSDTLSYSHISDFALPPPSQLPENSGGILNTVSNILNDVYSGVKNYFIGTPDNVSSKTSDLNGNIFSGTSKNSSLVNTKYHDMHGRQIKLSPKAAYSYEKLIGVAQKYGVQLRVSSTFRTVEEQRVLYQNAIKKYGSEEKARKWVAPPGKSQHNYGNAIDLEIYKNGKEVPQWQFDQIIKEAGFKRPMSWEGWHIEPV